LFEKESFITMDNIKFKNIKSNSKTVLYTLHNDIAMNNIEVDNVSCIGDSGDSSFILFNSNETNKKITIKNFYAKNCISNGSFITIIGNSNQLVITNSTLLKIQSYGPIIENLSLMVK